MSKFTTGEIAKLCGVSVRTVQYYDTRGILSPSTLSEGGRRLYSEDDLDKMKIICFLRDLDLPLATIAELMKEENAGDVIAILLEEQQKLLKEELKEKEEKLARLEELQKALKRSGDFTAKSIGDVAHIMKKKNELRRLRATMLLTGIPVAIFQWISIILWITSGLWWLFTIWCGVAVIFGIWISIYYFKRVAYICPACHTVFKPRFKQAFWANHTPTTRKLTCTACGHRGFCVETFDENA